MLILKKAALIIILLLAMKADVLGTSGVIQKGDVYYFSNYLVVKFKAQPQFSKSMPVVSSELNNYFQTLKVKNSTKFVNDDKKSGTGLDRIYYLQYDSNLDPLYISNVIKNYSEIEWAEPRFLYKVDYTPNDPSFPTQYSLSKIQASLAWDISKGDTNVVIGIVDTGVDWTHPDLNANIWINWAEANGTPGVDDDGNGHVDDIRGWDFGGLTGTPDNNPQEDQADHGTHVAGIVSAVTDNNIGISSIGFNCKIMPVKTAQNNIRTSTGLALISFGYEGIIYAADNNAKVINCSWGGSAFSMLASETIKYAINKGATVVCAAGNDGHNTSFYPASYSNVISVGASNSTDSKASFSNYGPDVDVMAPGVSILSTWQSSTSPYINSSGTSMASPMAAGLAALIKSQFPSYNARQVGEQLRVNCDDISSGNPGLDYLIGKGRINAYKSLSNTNSKSVRVVDYSFSDAAPGGNGDGVLQPGETISINLSFVNYLSTVTNLTVNIEAKNDYSSLINSSFSFPTAATMEAFNNSSNVYTFKLNDTMPFNSQLDFLLKFSDGASYSDFQWIKTNANPDYLTQSGNNVSLTITSTGTLAFNDYSTNQEGNGFHYKLSDNLMFEGALLTGISSAQISDGARSATGDVQNGDFNKIEPVHIRGNYNDHIESTTLFNDVNAGSARLGITTRLRSYTYYDPLYSNFILLRYTFTNDNVAALNNFYAGLFIDWDLVEGSGDGDITKWDPNSNAGYVYNVNQNPSMFTGTALVSDGSYNFWAILNGGNDGGFSIYDGFTDVEKWQAMSSGIGKSSAGPGDISHVVSGGPYSINPGESLDVAFIIGAGDSLGQFNDAVANARILYNNIITSAKDEKTSPLSFNLLQNYPNPFNPSTVISFSLAQRGMVTLKIYDILGKEVAVLLNEEKDAGVYSYNFNAGNLASGVYIYKLQSNGFTSSKKLMLLK